MKSHTVIESRSNQGSPDGSVKMVIPEGIENPTPKLISRKIEFDLNAATEAKLSAPISGIQQIPDFELAARWRISIQKVKDMCNPKKDPHYCPTVFHKDDFIKIGRGYLIMFNLSVLNPDECRPRVLTRPKPTRGNPSLKSA